MTRYVYLMERVSRREWISILTFKREIKIGISKNPSQRVKDVTDGIPGKIKVRAIYRVKEASRVESRLHRKFKKWNFKPKGAKKGAGGSEMFRLSASQLIDLKRELRKEVQGGEMWVLLKLAGVGYIIVYLLHHLKDWI